jgi:soluble lytic murein transglycosylase-like protein
MRRLLALTAWLVPLPALAGAQVYEPLAASVVANLSAAIAEQAPARFDFRRIEDARKWLQAMSERLRSRVPDRKLRTDLLRSVHHEATRAGLDPQLVLGVIEVESGFRKYATSLAGARGYMQVMPFWTRLLGRPHDDLYRLRTNLRYGCVILRYYLDLENGDYFRALGRYNGSLGDADYPNAVRAAWQGRWKYDGVTH